MAERKELSPQERFDMITANLQEVLNPEIIHKLVVEEDKALKVYWGTATTGRPHCGYFVPIMKIAELLQAGCKVKILLADVHATLDADKCPEDLVKDRAEYYRFCITELLKAVSVDLTQLEFVLGSTFQWGPAYSKDKDRMFNVVSVHDAQKAGSEVVKQEKDAKMAGAVYPIMQCLDEEHLDVDAQFGGVDQRKIFTLAKESLPKIGYRQRAHLMNPMVPGLQGGKMSASDANSKIDILDNAEVVAKKLKKAEAVPKVVDGNGLLSFIQYVLLPASKFKTGSPLFRVERRDEQEALEYSDISKIQEDYANDVLTPQLLKPAITEALNTLLAPVQKAFQDSSDWQNLEKTAYPPKEEVKKVKKVKNKGTGRPGAAKPEQEVTEGVEKLEVAA
ncbi:hypothetical protein BLS_004471 [Venturia inaequalis]|uniref:Tyrosine--tRNA ligase n=1 Tax=Venturia inaequalis TaxID=5025 RepID=A0A8H3YRX9_VENIN|nr:hypothetical protein BLS_004471 [Venturia inaequalis]KAE9973077.1 hypothetical protein EG328_004635 [Venturia inaequalis]KAE9992508.1 hypothetical protein EG327_008768 [Venturia inaequalis]RDI79642.1 hypothetical protein Vi05172_g10439 [Venturia inaequalis]